jgi:hypothetical protein
MNAKNVNYPILTTNAQRRMRVSNEELSFIFGILLGVFGTLLVLHFGFGVTLK